jgi:hypothetical protein
MTVIAEHAVYHRVLGLLVKRWLLSRQAPAGLCAERSAEKLNLHVTIGLALQDLKKISTRSLMRSRSRW